MVELNESFPHLLIYGRVENRDFTRQGRGDPKVRDVERRTHGQRVQQEVNEALAKQDSRRASFDAQGLRSELESLGSLSPSRAPKVTPSSSNRSTSEAGTV